MVLKVAAVGTLCCLFLASGLLLQTGGASSSQINDLDTLAEAKAEAASLKCANVDSIMGDSNHQRISDEFISWRLGHLVATYLKDFLINTEMASATHVVGKTL